MKSHRTSIIATYHYWDSGWELLMSTKMKQSACISLSHSAGLRRRLQVEHFHKNPWISPLTKLEVSFLCALDPDGCAALALEAIWSRGRLTRSPVSTAIVQMSHHDVILGFPLVIDLLCYSIDSRVQRAQICLDSSRDEEYLVRWYCTWTTVNVSQRCRRGLTKVHFVEPGSTSASGSAIRK